MRFISEQMMQSISPHYYESHYLPVSSLSKLRDCKLAAVYREQQNRTLCYEYANNHLNPRNLRTSDPSLYGNTLCPTNAIPSNSLPRLHAYNYQMYNERKYSIPNQDHLYDRLRSNYMIGYIEQKNSIPSYEDDTTYCKRPKSRNTRSESRLSKSGKSKRCASPNNSLAIRDANFNSRIFTSPEAHYFSMAQSFPQCYMQHAKQKYMCDNYGDDSCSVYSQMSTRVPYRSDASHGRLQQWPWSSGDMYPSSSALSPSSPLDSGLSSQSIASSPSLEGEPVQVKQIPECGSPVPLPSLQRNQCSCTSTSFPDPHALSPIFRSDSGRSSPWTQSAVSRLNALTEAKNVEVPSMAPIFVDVISPPFDVDQKRYSMSGILLSPPNRGGIASRTPDIGNRNNRFLQQHCTTLNKVHPRSYEYVEDPEPIPFVKNCSRQSSRRHESYNPLHIDIDPLFQHAPEYDLSSSSESQMKVIASNPTISLSNSEMSISPAQVDSKADRKYSSFRSRKLNSSEKAICELEEMYCKLNLQDYDLLDRAERRDLPTKHQASRLQKELPNLTRSKSDSFYEILGPDLCPPLKKLQRAPPLRRAGVPDPLADDMATRKFQKPAGKAIKASENTATYMLYSSHFTPSIPVPNEIFLTNKPDVEYDDLSYRRYYHMSSGKVSEPQPPFGIPLKPNPPQSVYSDYLHVVPSTAPQPLCHPRGNPDLVRDDLAFRSLRKESADRTMYDSYSLFCRKMR